MDCIHPTLAEDEGLDLMLYIDPDKCIDCGACEPACPVTAIFAEDDVPHNWREYTETKALWYRDKEAARQRVLAIKPGANPS